MPSDGPYLQGKKDKPGHCCAGNTSGEKFCQRWWVLTADEIQLCTWLQLETGVLIKYDPVFTAAQPIGLYTWSRLNTSPTELYRIQRDARPGFNLWRIAIAISGCLTAPSVTQPNDQDLLDDFSIETPSFVGTCDDPQPVSNLRAQSYRTVAAALLDYPDLQNWDWT